LDKSQQIYDLITEEEPEALQESAQETIPEYMRELKERPRISKAQIAILILLLVICFGGGVKYGQHLDESSVKDGLLIDAQGLENAELTSQIAINIKGAVENPGLYYLGAGSRLDDVLQQAVPLENADLDKLNLAHMLSDQEEIVVPLAGEEVDIKQTTGNTAVSDSSSDKKSLSSTKPVLTYDVNINTASSSELQALTGIGPVKAEAIIAYRKLNGNFTTIEDIVNVSGIGPSTYEKIKDDICID